MKKFGEFDWQQDVLVKKRCYTVQINYGFLQNSLTLYCYNNYLVTISNNTIKYKHIYFPKGVSFFPYEN